MLNLSVLTSAFILCFCSCLNETPDEYNEPYNDTLTEPLNSDSTENFNGLNGDSTKVKSTNGDTAQTITNGNHKKVKVPDLNEAPPSVWDDPDYVGTPCEYFNGECVMHQHKKPLVPPNE